MIASLVNKGALDIIAKVRPTKRVHAVVRIFLRRSTALVMGFAGFVRFAAVLSFLFLVRGIVSLRHVLTWSTPNVAVSLRAYPSFRANGH